MVRKTSIDVYRQIEREGLLSKRRFQAYDALYSAGPLTGNELGNKVGIPGLWKRCSELKRMDLAQEVGERICTVTGRVAIIWDVTDKLPVQKKRNPKKIKCLICKGRGWIPHEGH